jgi:hypothetical protein
VELYEKAEQKIDESAGRGGERLRDRGHLPGRRHERVEHLHTLNDRTPRVCWMHARVMISARSARNGTHTGSGLVMGTKYRSTAELGEREVMRVRR